MFRFNFFENFEKIQLSLRVVEYTGIPICISLKGLTQLSIRFELR